MDKKIVLLLVITITCLLLVTGCDMELGHLGDDHDHDGDGIQDHDEEDHHDEDEENIDSSL